MSKDTRATIKIPDEDKKKDTRATIKIPDEDKKKLDLVCAQLNMKPAAIIGYIVDQFIKYRMAEHGWVDALLERRFHQMLLEADIEYKKDFEKDKYRSVLRIQESMIREKIKAMPDEKKLAFIDEVLGSPTNAGDIIDRITSTQVYRVNSENRMLQPDQDGKPRISGIPPSQIVACDKGWHTAMDDCRACQNRATCEIRRGFIIEWLAVHGTSRQQEDFLNRGVFNMVKQLDE